MLKEKYNNLTKKQKETLFFLILNDYIGTIKVCYYCSSRKIKKNGYNNNIQRFICMKCNKTFGVNKLEPQRYWKKFLQLYSSGESIENITKKINISKQLVYRWKKKLDEKINEIKNNNK